MREAALTILMVEDDESIRNLLEMQLEECGYEVISCGTVADGSAHIEQKVDEIDLCLFDIRLPDGDGFALLAEMQTRRPRVPVVFMTGHGNKPTVIQALKNGAYDYIEKPFSVTNDLLPIVERASDRVRLAKENEALTQTISVLFDGLVQAAVVAIESRDPATRGHSERVSVMAYKLAEFIDKSDSDSFANISFAENSLEEIRYAGLLHDVGKIGIRENVLTKETKLHSWELQAVFDRLDRIRHRAEVELLEKLIHLKNGNEASSNVSEIEIRRQIKEISETLTEIWNLVSECNEPQVTVSEVSQRLGELVQLEIVVGGERQVLLTEHEVLCLSIPRGSLTPEERKQIESHVEHSYRFLQRIPWSEKLAKIPEIVFHHHEFLNGSGYPRGVTGDQIPLASQIVTIVDIYDSLVAVDRPYKKALPHQRAIDILSKEVESGRVDGNLLDAFLASCVWESVDYTVPAKVA